MDNHRMPAIEIDTDDEDAIQEDEAIKYLKKNFVFKDFWDYGPTRSILKNEFIHDFKDTVGDQAALFYSIERNQAQCTLSNIFSFDTDGTKGGILESIIYNHIRKDYDLEIFYNNPEWADSLVQWHLDNPKERKGPTFIIPKKSMRKFNWGSKKYEGD